MFSLLRMFDLGECLCSERNSISTVGAGEPPPCYRDLTLPDTGSGPWRTEIPGTHLQSPWLQVLVPGKHSEVSTHGWPFTLVNWKEHMHHSKLTFTDTLTLIRRYPWSWALHVAFQHHVQPGPWGNNNSRISCMHRSSNGIINYFSGGCTVSKVFISLKQRKCWFLMRKKQMDS